MKKIIYTLWTCTLFTQTHGTDITLINSDSTLYTKNTIVCSGNVIITYCNRVISADKISYDQINDIIDASGHVIIKDEFLNTYFLDSLHVEKHFKTGKAKNIKIISSDKSRLAAIDCKIANGVFELTNTVYTPCYVCNDSGALTWQLKASSVTFDPKEYTKYTRASFEVMDVPVLYIPYMTHVSPTVRRKSGFLVPKISTSSRCGFSILPQYLYSISDSQELILKPIITSKIGNVGWIYYGLKSAQGEFNIDTSITGTKSANNITLSSENFKELNKIRASGYRGHLFSSGRYEINNLWRSSFNINLASDNFYLKRFPFLQANNRVLESNANLECFDGNNYTSIKTAMFQGEMANTAPKILPVIEHNYTKDFLYGTSSIDILFMNLDFHDHRSARKIIAVPSWSKTLLLPFGNIIDVTGLISLRELQVSEKHRSDYNSSFVTNPQIRLLWQWPLLLSSSSFSTIVTPICGIIVASNKKCSDIFEDQFFEANDINLFDGSRSMSSYNIDSGRRVLYGTKISGYNSGTQIYRLTIGRSYDLTAVPERMDTSGLKHKHSHIMSSLDVFVSDAITFTSSGRYSTKDKTWSKIETGIRGSYDKFGVDILGFRGKQCFYDIFSPSNLTEDQKTQKYKGIEISTTLRANSALTFKAGATFGNKCTDLNEHNNVSELKLIKKHIGLDYKNECTQLELLIEQRNYHAGDLRPDTSIRLVVHLKNLGI